MITIKALLRLSLYEFLRDRVVWLGGFVAILLFAVSMLLGALSFNEQQRILAHIGLSAIQLSTLGMGLLLSASWLHKEMDRQTCLIVLARPVTREQFLLGKFLPIVILVLLMQILLSCTLYFLLGFSYPLQNYSLVIYGTFLEVVIAVTATFSMATFMRPMLAFVGGLSVFLIGHWTQEIEFFGNKTKNPVYIIVSQITKWLFPNLYQYNWRSVYFLENSPSAEHLWWVAFHGFGWILFLISVAILVFRRKDLV